MPSGKARWRSIVWGGRGSPSTKWIRRTVPVLSPGPTPLARDHDPDVGVEEVARAVDPDPERCPGLVRRRAEGVAGRGLEHVAQERAVAVELRDDAADDARHVEPAAANGAIAFGVTIGPPAGMKIALCTASAIGAPVPSLPAAAAGRGVRGRERARCSATRPRSGGRADATYTVVLAHEDAAGGRDARRRPCSTAPWCG